MQRVKLGPPRKRFGQHFLIDTTVVDALVNHVNPDSGERMLEIGPGTGILSRALLKRVPSLHAVEIDKDLCRLLREEFLPEQLNLHNADILRFDFSTLGENLRIVGNLPYNISTPLLFRIADVAAQVRDCHFMLQKEVVDRMAALPGSGEYGRLSVMIQYRFSVQALFDVAPQAFRPPPEVVSSVVRLIPRQVPPVTVRDQALFEDLVRVAFTQRRKMIRNALGHYMAEADWKEIQLNPTLRPENLSVADFAEVTNFLCARRQ